ncbi:H-NS histone family protein [Acinetobacter radioresistens]|uniref:H-NS histone family protein n=1 Tax=Acinetobacter radioresistens TaxID=40216 RepID=UPI002004CF2F|nr:H-NS histone family protein [Acinetobacter radioresistens]MCK4083763.1 H-NS histone family protein [Acinetobacter radioresistens]
MSKKTDTATVDIEQIGDIKTYLQGRSTEEIESIINNLHLALEEKKRENVREIYEKLVTDISALGYETIHDFISAAENYGIIKSNRAPRRPIPIRYRSTVNPEDTWTGRGKQPKWLQALIQQGHKIEEFEVSQEEIEAAERAYADQEEKAAKQPVKKPKLAKKPSTEKTPTEQSNEEQPSTEEAAPTESANADEAEQSEPNA